MKISLCIVLLALLALGTRSVGQPAVPPGTYTRWMHYGGSPDQLRYSSLRQIDRTNVNRLTVAWTYDSGESGGLQTQPLIVDGLVFGYTPTDKAFALRAATGEHLWTFDPETQAARGQPRPDVLGERRGPAPVRGVGSPPLRARRARPGKPVPTFGENGRIDLRAGLGTRPRGAVRPADDARRDLSRISLIVGGRVAEGLPVVARRHPRVRRAHRHAAAGRSTPSRIRASRDTRPGRKMRGRYSGGANSWAGHGRSTCGAASCSCRRAPPPPTSTARNRARRQPVRELAAGAGCAKPGSGSGTSRPCVTTSGTAIFPSPPSLVTVRARRPTVDAVAQTTKHGYVFVLDRTTARRSSRSRHGSSGRARAGRESRRDAADAPEARSRSRGSA